MADWENRQFDSGWVSADSWKNAREEWVDYGVDWDYNGYKSGIRVQSTEITTQGTIKFKVYCDFQSKNQWGAGSKWGYYNPPTSTKRSYAYLEYGNTSKLFDGSENLYAAGLSPGQIYPLGTPAASSGHGYYEEVVEISKSDLPITFNYKIRVGNMGYDTIDYYGSAWSEASVTVPKLGFLVKVEATNGVATVNGLSEDLVIENDSCTLKATPNTGYHFIKWSDDITDAERDDYKPTSDITLTAYFEPNSYTVHFNLNNESCVDDGKKPEWEDSEYDEDSEGRFVDVIYDSPYGELPNPERYGYEFNGWYTLPNGGTKIESTTKYLIDGGSTLYAHWKKKKFTVVVTIDQMSRVGIVGVSINDSNYDISVSDEFEYYTNITLHVKLSQEPPQPGYEWKFTGWLVNNQIIDGSNVIDYPVKVEGDTTYKANVTQGVKSYTVTIQTGTGVESIKLGHKEGSNEIWDDTLSKEYIYGLDIITDVVKFVGSDHDNPDAEHPWTGEDIAARYEWEGWKSQSDVVSTNKYYSFNLNEDITLTANCISHPKYTTSVSANSGGTVKFETERDAWDVDDIHRRRLPYNDSVWGGTKLKVRAIPDPGNMIDKWYVDGVVVESETGNVLEIEAPSQHTLISVSFKPWEYIWHKDDEDIPCHWNDYYIFVKTDKENTPWRVVKEIHHYINDEWKEE